MLGADNQLFQSVQEEKNENTSPRAVKRSRGDSRDATPTVIVSVVL